MFSGSCNDWKKKITYAFVDAVQEMVKLLGAVLVGAILLDAAGALLEVVLQWQAGGSLSAGYYQSV